LTEDERSVTHRRRVNFKGLRRQQGAAAGHGGSKESNVWIDTTVYEDYGTVG
jgi:hypothetical protein